MVDARPSVGGFPCFSLFLVDVVLYIVCEVEHLLDCSLRAEVCELAHRGLIEAVVLHRTLVTTTHVMDVSASVIHFTEVVDELACYLALYSLHLFIFLLATTFSS